MPYKLKDVFIVTSCKVDSFLKVLNCVLYELTTSKIKVIIPEVKKIRIVNPAKIILDFEKDFQTSFNNFFII